MGYLWRLVDKVIWNKKSEKLKLLDRKKINGPMPVNDVGFLSFTSIGWLSPLVMKLCRDRKQEIREEDVWTCSEPESCDSNTERLEPMWMDELMKYGRHDCSFIRLWLKFIWTRLLVVFLVLCFNALATFFSSGYIIDATTRYLEGSETSVPYAVLLVILGAVGQLLRVFSFAFIHTHGTQTGKLLQK
ncbi:multidrug resistance-associated protein 5-like [Pecten maximus]|uniref:multidrug resistance-associated protein 5-like n=1 Tax=Pecten maximus TaxID=6579 RepID=UPI0014586D2D|nr:multidrug resistance-associated protein 5-like [Pecten maximus]